MAAAADLRVFSQELSRRGARSFLVTSYAEFFRRYERAAREVRHAYEVIRQGTPARLYFDIEFQRDLNPGPLYVCVCMYVCVCVCVCVCACGCI